MIARLSIVLVVSCGGVPPITAQEPDWSDEVPWCVRMMRMHGDEARSTQVCEETRDGCESVRTDALRFGALRDVTIVGECYEW